MPDTNYITSAIRKFMLDMPSPGSFQNICLLRTTVALVSYIRNSLRFWYYASLSTCCQNLEEKIGVTGKIWEKAGVKLLMDQTEKSVDFSTLATSNIRLLPVVGEEDQ